jgi:hypothetical protein
VSPNILNKPQAILYCQAQLRLKVLFEGMIVMKKYTALIFGLILAAQLNSVSAAAELDKKQMRTLNRVENLEKQNDKDLAKYSEEQIKTNKNTQNNFMNLYKGIQRRLKEIDEKLAELPGDDPRVQALKEHAEKIKAQAEAYLKLVENANAAADAQEKASEKYHDSEEAEKDRKTLEDIRRAFDNYTDFDFSEDKHLYHYTDNAAEEARENAQAWLKAEQDLAAMIKRRDALGIRHNTNDESKDQREKGTALIAKIRSQGAQLLQPLNKSAEKALQEAAQKKNYKNLSDMTSDVSRMIQRVHVVGEIIKVFKPDASNQVDQIVKNLQNKQKQVIQSMAADIIAANRFPADGYSGADSGALKKYVSSKWKSLFGKDAILKVRLSGNWQRTTRWQWNASASAWDWKDYSVLHGHILVKHNADQAVSYYIRVIKRHTQKDQLDLAYDRNVHLSPTQLYLLKNVK